jgi:hypothetical protein
MLVGTYEDQSYAPHYEELPLAIAIDAIGLFILLCVQYLANNAHHLF